MCLHYRQTATSINRHIILSGQPNLVERCVSGKGGIETSIGNLPMSQNRQPRRTSCLKKGRSVRLQLGMVETAMGWYIDRRWSRKEKNPTISMILPPSCKSTMEVEKCENQMGQLVDVPITSPSTNLKLNPTKLEGPSKKWKRVNSQPLVK